MQEGKFESGKLTATAAVHERMEKDKRFSHFAIFSLYRHLNGDWGDLEQEDKDVNEEALSSGDRLFSAYIYKPTNEKIWIITEWDRSATTILFPSDY